MAGVMPAAVLASGDPRIGSAADIIGTSKEGGAQPPAYYDNHRGSIVYTDKSISFEEYHYWANRTRDSEKTLSDGGSGKRSWKRIFSWKSAQTPSGPVSDGIAADLQKPSPDQSLRGNDPTNSQYGVTDMEYYHAQRSVRTATWGAVFYLITTDILGPYSVPWAFSQLGYGPGTVLYVVFGFLAAYSGAQLWTIFMGLDSTKYPVRNYGDVAFRLFGSWARLICNILQSFQFFLGVTLLIVTNGQALVQMAAGRNNTYKFCFVLAEVIFMLCGFLLGQIRTLARLGWLANLAVWLNVFAIIMTMIVCASYPPNYQASFASYHTPPNQPIVTSAYWPPGLDLSDHVNGLMQAVYSYGGATLFNELMAEMRRPWDFWKSLICAEIFIFSVYVTMGLVVYSYQGQYAFNPAYQGIPNSAYAWQTVGNAITFISGLIAALLYGNIGVKVFYASVMRDVFHLPGLDKTTGKWLWVAIVPIYWALAFVLAAGVPQISYLGAFVGAACILQFSYTFPPLLLIGYYVQRDAMSGEEPFDPATGAVQHHDSGFKRYIRGYMNKPILNSFNLIYALGALATAGLGIYSSVIGMHASFTTPDLSIKSFSCGSPTG